MNKRHYEHTLPNIRGSLSNTYRLTVICPVGMGIRFCRDGLVRSVLCHCSHKQPMKNPPLSAGQP